MSTDSNWFTFKADIEFARPYYDEQLKECDGGGLSVTEVSQEMLAAMAAKEAHFFFRVDASTDELYLRVCRSNAPSDEPEDDLVFINFSLRNAERLRDALDAALKMMRPKNELGAG